MSKFSLKNKICDRRKRKQICNYWGLQVQNVRTIWETRGMCGYGGKVVAWLGHSDSLKGRENIYSFILFLKALCGTWCRVDEGL